MPNIWTHIMFCEEIIDLLDESDRFQDEQAYLNLGAQGPDPFFYHNYLPWKKDDRVNQVGNLLHKKHCGAFLLDLIKDATNRQNHTKAYTLGFVTHHILDRNTHPYIHYRSGYEGNKHQKLEVIIDTLMMKMFRNLQTWKVPVYKEINVGGNLDADIISILNSNIRKYYSEDLPKLPENYIDQSYRQMKHALRALFDPYGWKNRLLSSMVSSFSHQPIKVEKDYLNEDNTTWYHPATKDAHDESFLQLYEKGRNEGMEVLTAVLEYWNNPTVENEEVLTNLIADISYDTGKPLRENLECKYADPIV
jgi:hypothetical protein